MQEKSGFQARSEAFFPGFFGRWRAASPENHRDRHVRPPRPLDGSPSPKAQGPAPRLTRGRSPSVRLAGLRPAPGRSDRSTCSRPTAIDSARAIRRPPAGRAARSPSGNARSPRSSRPRTRPPRSLGAAVGLAEIGERAMHVEGAVADPQQDRRTRGLQSLNHSRRLPGNGRPIQQRIVAPLSRTLGPVPPARSAEASVGDVNPARARLPGTSPILTY